MTDHEWVMAQADRLIALGETEPRFARDPINQPQIHTWLEAIGDTNPLYRDTPEAARNGGPVAPTAMAQVWTMYGLDPHRPAGDPLHGMMQLLDEAGFTSVLGTNCDQTYARNLRPGEHVSVTTKLEAVVGPKKTGVGEGYFVTTRSIWRVGAEQVATMVFRVLKFKPAARLPALDPTLTIRPVQNRDTAFFWEGTALGELRIQKCAACGVLRHPPGPMCPACHAADRTYVVASGLGTVFSYVVHHAPQIPGKALPLKLVLVDLDEGVRMVGELKGEVEPDIGARVQVAFDRIDDDLTLIAWTALDSGVEPSVVEPSVVEPSVVPTLAGLPAWELPITPTLVVSTALATRDFQDVHHDRDLAVMRGSKDIFLNILTTTGLVQRYVSEWAGPHVVIRACELRLGAPAYPGDTLSFSGTVAEAGEVDGEQRQIIDVVGAVSLGSHVTARVTIAKGERP